MELKEKDAIRNNLQAYCERYPSQNKAAGSLKGVSAATVSTILNGKYDTISDEMFRNIASQVGNRSSASGWQIAETRTYQEIQAVMKDAQKYRNVMWIVGEAGCGKTTTAKLYAQEHKEAFYILCSEDMSKSEFIREIARTVGIRSEGYALRELWDLIISELIQMETPLIVFDEADKLKEVVFHYFVSFYNRLEEKCGIVFLSTDYIKRRMHLGLRHNKKGYNEIHSRIGRKFFELDGTTVNDVYAICTANGVSDTKQIRMVVKEAGACNYDLRRVKRLLHRLRHISA